MFSHLPKLLIIEAVLFSL